mmetsp:Transcript_29754/g.79058  ORF Transcript_29754/g.79058 Transcript_29754/m.79058 type:complete len:273 (+) Transcript_29754:401-1219(+)
MAVRHAFHGVASVPNLPIRVGLSQLPRSQAFLIDPLPNHEFHAVTVHSLRVYVLGGVLFKGDCKADAPDAELGAQVLVQHKVVLVEMLHNPLTPSQHNVHGPLHLMMLVMRQQVSAQIQDPLCKDSDHHRCAPSVEVSPLELFDELRFPCTVDLLPAPMAERQQLLHLWREVSDVVASHTPDVPFGFRLPACKKLSLGRYLPVGLRRRHLDSLNASETVDANTVRRPSHATFTHHAWAPARLNSSRGHKDSTSSRPPSGGHGWPAGAFHIGT